MKLNNKDMVLKCMAQIELLQQHVQNLSNAARCLTAEKHWLKVDTGNIRDLLIDAPSGWATVASVSRMANVALSRLDRRQGE